MLSTALVIASDRRERGNPIGLTLVIASDRRERGDPVGFKFIGRDCRVASFLDSSQ